MHHPHRLMATGLLATLAASAPCPMAFAQAATEQPAATVSTTAIPTHFTEPKREDGTVDCMAAINQWGKHVPNENNFAIAVANAMHPDEWPSPEYRKAVYQHWGLTPPPVSEGMLQLDQALYDKAKENEWHHQPWDPSKHTEADVWLKANEMALATVVDALTQTQWFWPVFDEHGSTDNMLYAANLPYLVTTRKLTVLAGMQAMADLQKGNVPQALTMLGQLQTFAARQKQPASVAIEQLVSISENSLVLLGLKAVLASPNLTPADLATIQRQLQQNAPLAMYQPGTEGMDVWMAQDFWANIVSGRIKYQTWLGDQGATSPLPLAERTDLRKHGMDANDGNQAVQDHFVALQEALGQSQTFETINTQLKRFEDERMSDNVYPKDMFALMTWGGAMPLNADHRFEPGEAKAFAKSILTTITFFPASMNNAIWKQHTQVRLLELIATLRASQLKTGQWPASLEDAVAAGICPAELIQDPFKPEQNLQYRLTEGGFDLWSISADLDNDQGLDKKQSQAKSNDPDDEGDWVIQFRLAQ